MKVIKFFVIGEQGIGKSTLIDTYLWKSNFGYAYHDHLMDIRRYHIQLVEISQFAELENTLNQGHFDIPIFLLCFKVTERKTLRVARDIWLPKIRRTHENANVFLMALQCDLRHSFRQKIMQKYIRQSEGLRMCRYYPNLHYLECSSLCVKSVKDAVDKALEIVLYNEKEAEMRIAKLYNMIRIQKQFNKENACKQR